MYIVPSYFESLTSPSALSCKELCFQKLHVVKSGWLSLSILKSVCLEPKLPQHNPFSTVPSVWMTTCKKVYFIRVWESWKQLYDSAYRWELLFDDCYSLLLLEHLTSA